MCLVMSHNPNLVLDMG
ncbi:hypothetical protein F383_37424 [Gossypium arboreum]|uniref:Uncharacterized protein n=1 Tax=Gossypium arboreum TaxID=29729 RepID=A0A0B0MES4_GOSAR|nr:hypothetical protein F383_37424 [Gossypium arboreum]